MQMKLFVYPFLCLFLYRAHLKFTSKSNEGRSVKMEKKKIYRRVLIAILFINISAILGYSYYNLDKKIPNNIKLMVNTDDNFDFSLPLHANLNTEDIKVINVNSEKIPDQQIKVNFIKPFTLRSDKVGSYTMDLKLFGVINLKKINVDVIDNEIGRAHV